MCSGYGAGPAAGMCGMYVCILSNVGETRTFSVQRSTVPFNKELLACNYGLCWSGLVHFDLRCLHVSMVYIVKFVICNVKCICYGN
jgi:hypothetical protein